jgi:transcriptional regulator with XRE-family HTH domain
MSQTELAHALGLSSHSKGFISEIESGKKLPRAELILRIANRFGVSTDYLMRDDAGVDLDEASS